MLFHCGYVLRHIAPAQQATMHSRVQCLHAAIHHFWKAGQFFNWHNRNPRGHKRLGGATRADNFNAIGGQRLSKLHQAAFVTYGK